MSFSAELEVVTLVDMGWLLDFLTLCLEPCILAGLFFEQFQVSEMLTMNKWRSIN